MKIILFDAQYEKIHEPSNTGPQNGFASKGSFSSVMICMISEKRK